MAEDRAMLSMASTAKSACTAIRTAASQAIVVATTLAAFRRLASKLTPKGWTRRKPACLGIPSLADARRRLSGARCVQQQLRSRCMPVVCTPPHVRPMICCLSDAVNKASRFLYNWRAGPKGRTTSTLSMAPRLPLSLSYSWDCIMTRYRDDFVLGPTGCSHRHRSDLLFPPSLLVSFKLQV
jgi:hypothetical protein